MALSLQRFLKLTDDDMLFEYFKKRSIDFGNVAVDASFKVSASKKLEAMILELQLEQQIEILRDFDLVDQLISDVGQRELRQVVVARQPGLLARFDEIQSAQGRGLFVLLNDMDGFDVALSAEYVESRREKTQWSSFNVPSNLKISTDDQATDPFLAVASALFQKFDGSGRHIEVNRLDRKLLDQNGEPDEDVVQINLNVEGPPKSQYVFKNGKTDRQIDFPAIEAAEIYQPQSGVLAVTSRGGRPVHKKLAKAFAQHLLRCENEPIRVELRLVHLEKLRRPMAFDRDPADGIDSVRVTKLRLFSDRHGDRRIQFELGPNAEESLTEFAMTAFPNDNPLTDDDWWVKAGEIKFVFAPKRGQRRGQTMAVNLCHPNGCNIREQSLERQALAEKYLKRWGILERLA